MPIWKQEHWDGGSRVVGGRPRRAPRPRAPARLTGSRQPPCPSTSPSISEPPTRSLRARAGDHPLRAHRHRPEQPHPGRAGHGEPGLAHDRPHPGPHRGRAAPPGRRDHRLRDHPAPDPAHLRALRGQPAPAGAGARVRAVGHHPRGAARGARGDAARGRVADLPDRAADGRGDRRRTADPRTARQHGRRHRWWHERSRGDLARRDRRVARGARRRFRPRPRDPGAPASRAQRRGR